jgi:hypothetical protein
MGQSPATDEQRRSNGRLRALNDGWVPIVRPAASTLRLARNETQDNEYGSFESSNETRGRKRKSPPAEGR